MNNFLLTLGAIVVIVLGALFAVPPFIDWNSYRGAFEEEVSRLLDREVRVKGRVSVSILPIPFVSFEKVRIADQPGIPGSFVRAEQFKMWLSVPPLLRGVIEARQIELEQPVLRLRMQADGTGNWRELRVHDSDLAFLPRDVALNSVVITDGTVVFEHGSGDEITRIANISGELSAAALRGPYKFVGTVKAAGAVHDVRVSTAPLEADGNIRFRGNVRDGDAGIDHTIDGTINEPLGKSHITGRLRTRAPKRRSPDGKGTGDAYEMTSKIRLDADAFRLDDIAITFQNKERLQTLTGSAETSWQDGLITQTSLKAPWLDLDAVAGTGAGDRPLTAIRSLLTRSLEPLGAGVTRVNLDIEQGRLAGATLSGLEAGMIRRSGITKIDHLRVTLPGLTAVVLDGFVDSGEAGLTFDGNVVLRSASFGDFAGWLLARKVALPGDVAGAVSLNGGLRVRPALIEVSDATAAISGERVGGSVLYDTTKRRARLAAELDAGVFDLRTLGDDRLDPNVIAAELGLRPPSAGQRGVAQEGALFPDADLDVRLRASRLSDGRRTFEDVALAFKREGNRLEIDRLAATWQPGLKLDLGGKLSRLDARPFGNLKGTIAAATGPAARHFASLVSDLLGQRLPSDLVAKRAPLRLALDAKLGPDPVAGDKDPAYATTIVADGETAGARLRVTARTAGPFGAWRSRSAQIEARLSGPDALKLAGWVLGDVPAAAAGTSSATPATVVFSATGVPDQEMKTFARFAAPRLLTVDYAGNFQLTDADQIAARWSGALDFARADTDVLAHLLWPRLAGRLEKSPIKGRVEIAGGGETLSLKPDRLEVAGSRISGELSLAPGSRLTGRLHLSKAPLAGLAGFLLAESDGAPAEPPTDDAPPWPSGRFDFSHLAGFDTDLQVTLARLTGTTGKTVARDITTRLELGADRVAVTNLEGRLGDGRMAGTAHFAATPAGTAFRAHIKAGDIPLAMFAPSLDAGNRLAGRAAMEADLDGRALSPAALAGTVKGSGRLRLSGAKVPGLTGQALTDLARKVIAGELEPDALPGEVRQSSLVAAIDIGSPSLEFTVQNGIVNVPAIVVGGENGSARNVTVLGLRDWRFDGRWTVRPAPLPKPEVAGQMIALPPVTLIYGGIIGSLGQIEPKIDLGDLERELVVAKMEANVARLERLRREDEERARQEAERQRQRAEAERQAREAERQRLERERADRQRARQQQSDGWESRVKPEPRPPSQNNLNPAPPPRPL